MWPAISSGLAIATGTAAWAAFQPGSQLFGPTLVHLPSASSVALTFDDGPNPAATPAVLDLLDQHGVTATFFVIGQWARDYPTLVAEIAARGHAIGNHTDTHPNLVWLSIPRILTELLRCQATIEQIVGRRPTLVRPPYGYRGPQFKMAVEHSGLAQVVMWSVMGRDWTERGKRALVERLRRVRGSDIVVLHDGSHTGLGIDRADTLRALEYWLPRWRDAGLQFVSLAS
jgi:peptidoglycan-N-acetylglucosamine deacetylase